MNWLRNHPQSATLVGLTLVVPVLLFLYLLGSLWGQRGVHQDEIERLAPRIARLQGLIASEEALRVSAARVDSRVLDLVYPASGERATIAAALQQDVRKILTDAGLDIRNSQVLPAREIGGLDYLTVKVQVSGDLEALDAALEEFADYLPLMLVESLDITPVRQSRRRNGPAGRQAVTASLQLLSFRVGATG